MLHFPSKNNKILSKYANATHDSHLQQCGFVTSWLNPGVVKFNNTFFDKLREIWNVSSSTTIT